MTLSERIPGMRSGHTVRNIALGIVYLFVVMGVIGAVTSPSEQTPATATTPTATSTPVADGGSTSTATTTATATATSEASATPTANDKATATATADDTTTATSTADDESGSGYTVKIIADGAWSGSIATGESSRSIEGEGTTTITVERDVSIISANAQKQAANSNELTIQILKDGEVVKESSTSAEYGLAQVSYSALEGLDGTSDESKQSPYSVRISYDGEWSGAVSGEGSIRSVQGEGTKTFQIKGEPFVVSANAQKRDGGSGTLTVQILKNGEVIKESSTDAEYGIASVSVTT
jgi:hypothetical protein